MSRLELAAHVQADQGLTLARGLRSLGTPMEAVGFPPRMNAHTGSEQFQGHDALSPLGVQAQGRPLTP